MWGGGEGLREHRSGGDQIRGACVGFWKKREKVAEQPSKGPCQKKIFGMRVKKKKKRGHLLVL